MSLGVLRVVSGLWDRELFYDSSRKLEIDMYKIYISIAHTKRKFFCSPFFFSSSSVSFHSYAWVS